MYELDGLLQEESNVLQNLQKDKDILENAITGIQRQIQNNISSVYNVREAQQQKILLEHELSNVYRMLATNSKVRSSG